MYRIKLDKIEELKEGKTGVYLESKIGYTRQYLSEIFSGRRVVDKETIEKILKPICAESVKLKEKLERGGMDKLIEYFFNKI